MKSIFHMNIARKIKQFSYTHTQTHRDSLSFLCSFVRSFFSLTFPSINQRCGLLGGTYIYLSVSVSCVYFIWATNTTVVVVVSHNRLRLIHFSCEEIRYFFSSRLISYLSLFHSMRLSLPLTLNVRTLRTAWNHLDQFKCQRIKGIFGTGNGDTHFMMTSFRLQIHHLSTIRHILPNRMA